MSGNSRLEQRNLIRQRQQDALRQLLVNSNGKPSSEIVERLKKDLGVSRATAYRMVKSFRSCGAINAGSRPVGRPKGARVLDERRERIIHDAIVGFYYVPDRPSFSELVREIGRRCHAEALPTPNWRTVRVRVSDLEGKNGANHSGRKG